MEGQEQIAAVGRRKESVARVYLKAGTGKTLINGQIKGFGDLAFYRDTDKPFRPVCQDEDVILRWPSSAGQGYFVFRDAKQKLEIMQARCR